MEDANQNNVEATTAEEEAQRHGSKEKQSKLEQGGSEVSMYRSTDGYLALEQAPENAGEESEQGRPDRNLLIGDGVGPVHPGNFPRGKFRYEKLGRQQETMKDDMEDDRSSESAEVTVGTMEMGPSTNTRSNPSLGNAESSFKSKTAEWALLVVSVVLEATSAIFEQLGYPLTSMVMAFVALFLSILDLILKARGREITCDGRGLPCFNRHSSHDSQNSEPFAGVVQYFGLAGALWQCSFTTVGYHYTHQKLVNPIKLCLLPFILALCVLISKVVKSSNMVVKSSQHDR